MPQHLFVLASSAMSTKRLATSLQFVEKKGDKQQWQRVAALGEKIIKNATFLAMTPEKCETFLKKGIAFLA